MPTFSRTLLLAGLLATAATATASPVANPFELPKCQIPPGIIITQCRKPGVMALGYDDGPYTMTLELVDMLDAAGAKATFFWTGTLYGCIYDHVDAIKKAYASGHQVASHTWTHPITLDQMSKAELTEEMEKLENAFANILGIRTNYMRPPYLMTGGEVMPTMGELGYKVITLDLDSGDWDGVTTAAESARRFEEAGTSGRGHIPLVHETYESTVRELTPWIIEWAAQNNLELVTIADCLDDPSGPYVTVNATGDGQMTC
ncbi:chitin deacetylase [Sodiomyces alkalinus F11]|uniref:Chitin deacetylase n=1 Tax=Sodiomyces alkalinus (strain CBS 110278 / VKM F-3762 / F11) TaxID=1314773 RepID=A0A3N2PV85_SODAK|nr:chitin deacetylase [Sodiomyces alkalinus F11]ROT38400.1 chitin deacetylase [Sodiomyces alkalinus F11]